MTVTAYLFTGYPGCGKTTALREAYENDLQTIEMGQVVRNEYRDSELVKGSPDDNDLGKWASRKREDFGEAYFAEKAMDRVRLSGMQSDIAISGIRSMEEVEVFRNSSILETVTIVGIVASRERRAERLQGRDDANHSYLAERDQREREWGLEKVMRRGTDLVIRNNECSLARFRSKIGTVVNE